MPFESGYVTAPWQGVTQAAPAFRLSEQASVLDDSLVEIQKGWRKRPPMIFGAKVANVLSANANVHDLLDPATGALLHLVLDYQGGHVTALLLDAITLASLAVTVTGPAQTYLDIGPPNPHQDLRVLTAEDFTFVLNRNSQITLDPTPNASRPHEGLIFVKEGGYGWTYNVSVKKGATTTTVKLVAPSGAVAGDSRYVGTNEIANAMLTGIHAYDGSNYQGTDGSMVDVNGGGGPGTGAGSFKTILQGLGFTVTLKNSVIYLSNATDFTINTDDGHAGIALSSIKDSTQNFSDLPETCPVDGFTVKISPVGAKVASGSYYVQFSGSGNSQGIWKEVLGPGAATGILVSTLPVALRKVAGVWTLDVVSWKQRTTGDASSCPDPGFVNDYLKDMAFYGGRLGLMYHEGCLFCAADDPFRLYPSTVVTELDSDPFEIDPPDEERAFWEGNALIYGGIVFIGRRSQDFLQNADVGEFTVKSAQIKRLGKYQPDTATKLKAIASNERIYLATPRGANNVEFFEFAADRLSGRILPDDISAHIPTLLPNTLDRVATVEPSFAILYGSSAANALFLGMFRYANYQRVQTAWFPWFISGGFTLAGLTAHGSAFYLLLRGLDGAGYYATIELSPDVLDDDPSSTVLTKLDIRVSEAACTTAYNAGLNQTTITPPTPVTVNTQIAARAPGGVVYGEGYLASVISRSGTQIVVTGDWTATPFYCGYSYTATWEPTTIYRMGQDHRPVTRARMTVADILLDVTDMSTVTVQVSQPARSIRSYTKGAITIGSIGQFTGQWRVPVNGQNVKTTLQITDAVHIGGKVGGFEWFGHFDPFFQRTT